MSGDVSRAVKLAGLERRRDRVGDHHGVVGLIESDHEGPGKYEFRNWHLSPAGFAVPLPTSEAHIDVLTVGLRPALG